MFGKPAHIAHRTKAWMVEAGFEDVHEKVIKTPLGPWAKDPNIKEIGKYALLSALTGFEGFTMALFTRILGYVLVPGLVVVVGGWLVGWFG